MVVAEYLPPSDLANFMRVNRCLYELLTPLLNRCALYPRYRKIALQYAAINAKRALIRLLVTSANCILACRDDPHQTIIFVSPAEHHIEQVVDDIVLEGNRLIVQDTYTYCTPLHDAVRARMQTQVQRLLLLGVEIDVHDFRGWTALHHAVWENDLSTATMLIKFAAFVDPLESRDMSPLHFAAYVGNIKMVALLLSSGADTSLHDLGGYTPIELAKKRDYSLDSLLLRKSTASFRSITNQTALQMASCLGDLTIITTLIAAGVPVTASDNFGGTALHESSAAGHPEIVATLLRHGAAVNAQDSNGTTPLHCAATEEIAIILLANNADMKIYDNRGATPLDYIPFEALLHSADPAMRAGAGCTPLHIAVAQGSIECTKALLVKGADTDAADEQGWTPLHLAAEAGNFEIMDILIEAGANEDARCNEGKTPQDIFDELESDSDSEV